MICGCSTAGSFVGAELESSLCFCVYDLIFCGSCSLWKWKVVPDERTGSTASIGQRISSCYAVNDDLIVFKGRCHTAVVSGSNIIFFGGSLPSTNCLSVLDTRSFKSRDIVLSGNSIQRRLSHCAAVVDGSMIIIGGWSVNSQRASTTLRDCFQIQAHVSRKFSCLFFGCV